MFKKIKKWARKIKTNILALYLILKREDVAWYKKVYIGFIVSYALSPIDLVPDFIPILGYLDDAIILPILILLAMKMIPSAIVEECKLEAEVKFHDSRPKSIVAGIIILLIWAAIILFLIVNYSSEIVKMYNEMLCIFLIKDSFL